MKRKKLLQTSAILLAGFMALGNSNPPSIDPVALTIAGEAGGEGKIGMYAVGCVIQNRAIRWHLRPREVVSKGFMGLRNPGAKKAYLAQKKYIDGLVSRINDRELRDITHGATHFDNVLQWGEPYWASSMKKTCSIKNHTFYREVR